MHTIGQPRTVILTERRPYIARLAPLDVAFLLEHHRGQLEVLPSGRRDRYRLTALDCVGVLVAPTCRFVIRPKIPLANVFAMLAPLAEIPAERDAIALATGTEALDFLAGQLARRMNERVAAGLHRVYREQREQGTTLHGRIDLSSQLREAPGRKDQLHSQYDELSCDVPCNRVVKATAESLLACSLLDREVRATLRRALAGFAGVSSVPLSERSWDDLERECYPAEYQTVLDLCRILANSLQLCDGEGPTPVPSFLLDMDRVFEQHITRGIVESFQKSRKHQAAVQRSYTVNRPVADQPDVMMRPDLTIHRDEKVELVVDAKWKQLPGSVETADLYQVLAYGTGLGAQGVALVYPGRRWSVQEYSFLHTPLRLTVFTVSVTGKRERCVRSVGRLAQALKSLL